MKSAFFRLALPLLLIGCAAQQPPRLEVRDTDRLRQAGAEVLFWSQEQRDSNFRSMETLFPSNIVRAGRRARPLPAGAPLPVDPARTDALIESQNIAALIVVHDGRVRLERYSRGLSPDQRWTSFSVAKSLTSILVGAAVRDGHIGSLDDPVVRYVPELAGSAYDGVTVRQVLTMSSGVRWNEDYRDPQSDVARMFATAPPEGMDPTLAYLRGLPRAAEPGTRWNYNTAETNLVGIILSRAVGRPLARYASDKLWRPFGMEADAYWQVDQGGHEIAGCCVSARPRDYARIGQFMLEGGGNILPPGWIAEATRPHHSVSQRGDGYGYQWWTLERGYMARGIFGQSIRIDPERRLVMVTLSAWPRASDLELSIARESFFRHVGAAVEREAD